MPRQRKMEGLRCTPHYVGKEHTGLHLEFILLNMANPPQHKDGAAQADPPILYFEIGL